jgi:hypothetical protein
MFDDLSILSFVSVNAAPVIKNLSFEIGFFERLTFKIASKASILSFFILFPES